jgi:hypothetical protein
VSFIHVRASCTIDPATSPWEHETNRQRASDEAGMLELPAPRLRRGFASLVSRAARARGFKRSEAQGWRSPRPCSRKW